MPSGDDDDPDGKGSDDDPDNGKSKEGPYNQLGLRCQGGYCPAPPMRYLGGPVQHEPLVHLIFWGSNWNSGSNAAAKAKILELFEVLSGSAYQGILTQYFDPTGYISANMKYDSLVDTRLAAPSKVTYSSMEPEIEYAIGQKGWKREPNAQFLLLTAPGSTYAEEFDGFCAYHEYDYEGGIWGVVPWHGDPPFNTTDRCPQFYGEEDPTKSTSLMAAHEYAEAATDPLWYDEPAWQNLEGYELADMCSTLFDEIPGKGVSKVYVQGLYDDHQSACSLGDKEPPHILGLTDGPSEVTRHTAQIHGTVNPEGSEATYRFEYGTTTSYGTSIPEKAQSVGGGKENITVQANLSGLQTDQVYHYRIVATNSAGTTYGEDRTFLPSAWTIHPQAEPLGRWAGSWLNDVDCAAQKSCVAVGHYGNGHELALAYTGSGAHWSWTDFPIVKGGGSLTHLEGVSCSSPTACTAVGRGESESGSVIPRAARWNGSSWTIQEVPVPAGTTYGELASVSCPSSTECVAVGDYKNSEGVFIDYSTRWSGGAWSTLSTPNPPSYSQSLLKDISCPAVGSCKAVGWYSPSTEGGAQKVIMAWNGSAWSMQTAAVSEGFLQGVDCTSVEFCFAVGGYGTVVERWNGSAWSSVATPALAEAKGGYLESVSCVSAIECTAVGNAFSEPNEAAYTLAEDWNGSSWTVSKTPRESERAYNELSGVSCFGSHRCTAVGGSIATGIWEPVLETRPAIPTYESSFGSKGSGNGQVESPWGLDADGQGNVWVADRSNNRIEEFNEKGEYVTKFGTKGSGNGQLSEPLDVALDSSGNLWVTDSGNHRVEEFNAKGEYVSQFGSEGTGDGQFVEPWSIDIAPDGNIWVADARYYRVEEFTPKGEFIRTVSGFEGPHGLEVDSSGHVWVTDSGSDQVWELSATGEKLQHFGEKGSGDGQLDEPEAVAITPSGEVLVADRFNGRVVQFAPDGEFEAQIGTMGSGTAQLKEPRGIAAGEGGTIYISDTFNNRLQRWFEAGPPSTTTKAATEVTSTSARLAASINPVGASTTYHFEYDTTKYQEGEGPHGTAVPVPDESIGSGRSTVEVTKQIGELQPNTIYHFRAVANSPEGTVYGKDAIFITPAMVHPHWASCTKQTGGRFTSSKCSTEGSPNEWEALHLKTGEKTTITAKGNPIVFSAVVSGITTTFSCETEVAGASLENPSGGGSGLGNAEVKYKGCKAEGVAGEKGCKVANTANYPSKLELTIVEGKTEVVLVPKEGTTFASFSFSGCAGSKVLEELNGAWSLTGIAYALYSNAASQLEFNATTGNLLKLRSQTASATGSIKLETTAGGYIRGQVEPHWAACTKQSGGRYTNSKCSTEGSPNEWEALSLKTGEKSTIVAKGNPITFASVQSGISTAFSCETEVSGASLENPVGGGSGVGNAEVKYIGCKTEGVMAEKGCKVANTANYPSKLELTIVEGKTEVVLVPKEGTNFATFNFSSCAGSKALEGLNGSWGLTGIANALYSNTASQLEFSVAAGGQLKLRNQPASATGSVKLESTAGGYIAASNGDLAVLASQPHWSACVKQSSGKYTSNKCGTEGKPKEWESLLLKTGEETTIVAKGSPIAFAAVVSGISTAFSCETEVSGASLENPVGGGRGLGNAEVKYKGCKTEGVLAEKGCKVETTANYPSKLELTIVEGKTEVVLVPKEGTNFATFNFSGCAGSKALEGLNGAWSLTGTAYALYSNAASQLEFNATTGNQLKLRNQPASATGSIMLETTGGGYISAPSTYIADLPRNHWSACSKQSGGRYASGTCRTEGSPYEWEALSLKTGEKTTITAKGNPVSFSTIQGGISAPFTCETEVASPSLENPSGGGNGVGNAEVKYKGCKPEGTWGEKGCKVENAANYPSKLELTIVEAKTEVVLKPSSGETFATFTVSGCSGSKTLEGLNGTWSLTGSAYGLYSNAASKIELTSATTTGLKLRNQNATAVGSIGLETTGGGYVRAE